jgi:hypothetical protein
MYLASPVTRARLFSGGRASGLPVLVPDAPALALAAASVLPDGPNPLLAPEPSSAPRTPSASTLPFAARVSAGVLRPGGNASLCRSGAYVATRAAGRTPMRGLARSSAEVV